MSLPFDLSALHRALTASPAAPAFDQLRPLPPNGLDNDHVRIRGTGTVARVPRWPLDDLGPADALVLRAARFRRAAACGHVPALHAALPAADGLPNGALVVDEIDGRPAEVPGDMAAIADALAALHGLDLPPSAARAPLPDTPDPAAALIDRIERQSAALSAAGADETVQRRIGREIEAARRMHESRRHLPQPVCLVGTDTHPGNFLVTPQGRAILVDLDKAMYGSPAVDLAHASLATSVFWATSDWNRLQADARRAFYRRYLAAVPPSVSEALRPWLAPMARLTWLRTTTWAATWRLRWMPALRRAPGMEALVAQAEARTAALLAAENVEREADLVPSLDAEEPA